MAVSSSSSPGVGTKNSHELQLRRSDQRRQEVSPDRTVVWTEPLNPKPKKVPVLYYLSRNGQLEHPHFMEVPLSSSHGGLFLRDVMSRLNLLRGEGMASLYSWSCKRSYKNGFVWQDLSETDLIPPTYGHDYVLKGSELPEQVFLDMGSPSPARQLTTERRRRNQSCSSIDFEYGMQKTTESSGVSRSVAADASTQAVGTVRRPSAGEDVGGDKPPGDEAETEIEISPSPSDSSPETLETLMKADGRAPPRPATASGHHDYVPRRPCRSSSVLMQLISCGSIPFKDCGAGQGLGLIVPNKERTPRGGGTARGKADEKEEYKSGSLDQGKKEEFPALKMSTSYIADGGPHGEVPDAAEKVEIDGGVKAKCIPRKPKS